MSTLWPSTLPSTTNAWQAVSAGMPRQAPAAMSAPVGSGTACAAGSTTYCAAVPSGRPQAVFHSHTRAPSKAGSTPSPTWSTVPAPSLCGTMRAKGRIFVRSPARVFTSDGLTPEQAMRTPTSPARDPALRFNNGHFTMIGLKVNNKPLLRAYSIVSANYEEHLEFLSIKVPDGPLTSRLQHIQVGDSIVVGRKPTGTLVVDYLLPGKRLYLPS